MNRNTRNHMLIDLLIGATAGILIYVNNTAYLIIWCVAAVALIVILIAGGSTTILTPYGHNKNGRFSIGVFIARIITVNIGVIIGYTIMVAFPKTLF